MTHIDWIDAWSLEEGAARVSKIYAEVFGGDPTGTWSAPGRANLIGEHTDYNGGLVFPFALLHRTYVALTPRTDSIVRIVSGQESMPWEGDLSDAAPGSVSGWAAYVVGVAWALREAGYDVRGFDAAVTSCVPYGAGLSSSAALEASVAVALDSVYGLGLGGTREEPNDDGRKVLVEACIRAEREMAGANTGGMDQSASLRSREGYLLLLDCLDQSISHVPFDLESSGLALLVIDTRAPHQLVDGQYAARRATCEAAARALGVGTLREIADDPAAASVVYDRLAQASTDGAFGDEALDVVSRRVRHVLGDIERVHVVERLLAEGRTAEVGPVLTEAHASLRDDYEVSCDELDLAVDAAIAAGALGGRMVGGGFGGSAIALVKLSEADAIAAAVVEAFAGAGYSAPGFMIAAAGAPAF
ncbi:galactokinase [Timonella senegalensis]|uniref:galactokinase n=1 Tax=Timonella senegalensis TaxID=1465825 RepID=UPI0002FA8636|nr:galactokinase [Timonella senegalensis]